MIQPAAPSATSPLALVAGMLPGQADGAAVSVDFASLLITSLTPEQAAPLPAATLLEAASDAIVRQGAGKPSGKDLPLALPVGAVPSAMLAEAVSSEADADAAPAADSETAPTDEAVTVPTLPAMILAIAVPVSTPVDNQPSAPVDRPEARGSSAAPTPTTQPQTQALPNEAVAVRPIDPVQRGATKPALPIENALATQTETAASNVVTSAPDAPVTGRNTKARVPASQAVSANRTGTVRPDRTERVIEAAALPAAVAMQPAPAIDPIEGTNAKSPVDTATTLRQRPSGPLDAAAAAMTTTAAPTLAAAVERAADLPVAAAAEPQIVVVAPANTATSAPATAPSAIDNMPQRGHDFAALVDRLVEAREAAVPQAVHAALAHSEFGQVSLRFDQDGDGLSVAMTSPDPDFARAVQAGAATTQAQTSTGDNGSASQRQEGQSQHAGQHAGSSTLGQQQSQSSARNDRSGQTASDTRSGTSAGKQSPDDETAEQRGGIYA